MISRAIWYNYATINLSKTLKIELGCNFFVFEKISLCSSTPNYTRIHITNTNTSAKVVTRVQITNSVRAAKILPS